MQEQEKKDIRDADVMEAGTGFMESLSDMIHHLQKKGYGENFGIRGDHFESHSGQVKLYPQDFCVDKIYRYENTSDPDDSAIVYAISSDTKGVKGVYVESYGLYHDEMSPEMLDRLRNCLH